MFVAKEVKNISKGAVSCRSLNYLEVCSLPKASSRVFKDQKEFSKFEHAFKRYQKNGLLEIKNFKAEEAKPVEKPLEEKKENAEMKASESKKIPRKKKV